MCACMSFSVASIAQSAELAKFKTFRQIKDSVSSFEPLREIIDCGFKQLTVDPTNSGNYSVIATLTSNTSSGLRDFKDQIKYSGEWATYVESMVAKKLTDNTISTESKAAFMLVKAVLDMNSLPATAKLTKKDILKLRKTADNIYKIYPSLPYMVTFEYEYDNLAYAQMTRKELLERYLKMSKIDNKRINEKYSNLYKELTIPFELKFTAYDGREIDLKNYKGKVVLVDFWATWCGPCVAEMPHVKAVYEKYKGRGFEVIGISLDANKDRLDEYLKKNGISWAQYFDGKGWNNELAVKHGVKSVPAAFLIDRDGTLITKKARAEVLDKAMEELFK